jgi:hypothetical protein
VQRHLKESGMKKMDRPARRTLMPKRLSHALIGSTHRNAHHNTEASLLLQPLVVPFNAKGEQRVETSAALRLKCASGIPVLAGTQCSGPIPEGDGAFKQTGDIEIIPGKQVMELVRQYRAKTQR